MKTKLLAAALIITTTVAFIEPMQSGGIEGKHFPVSGGHMLTQKQALSAGFVTSITTRALPSGGSSTTYQLANGITMKSFIPPSGFSPLNATASELADYGFPSRPNSAFALSNWDNVMSHFVTAFDGPYNFSSSPPNIDQTTFSGQPVSGFDATGSAGTYDGASANFNIPTVTNTLLCTTPYFSIWTGLGGQDTSRLIQTGMIYNLGQVPQPTSSDWTSFYELIDSAHNNPPVNLIIAAGKSWHVNTGDIMYSQTTYSSPSGGTAFLYLEDQTSGLSANVTLTGISAYYDGTTADAFVENHPNFPFVISQINWQYDWAELSASGIWDPILNVPQNKYIGIYSTPSTLSTTDNTSFNVNSTYKCT